MDDKFGRLLWIIASLGLLLLSLMHLGYIFFRIIKAIFYRYVF